ncbi:MAG TPA: rod shape-determining protein MreC [Candidatus Dormibacteraeota bacterium]|nr:rod shape-determining protein MreC [Candidatus Dormibacteraeota bacterium]
MRRGSQPRATSYLLIAVALAIVLIGVGETLRFSSARDVAAGVFAPFQAAVMSASNGVGGFVAMLTSIGNTADENRRLKQHVADLERQLAGRQQQDLTDQKLKALLGVRDSLQIHTVTAQVIGLDPEALTQTMTIHAGTSQGVRKGMSVLGQRGLVGKVISVQSNTAAVRLISDPQLPVNAEVATTHLGGTIKIKDGQLVDEILGAPTDLKLNQGETLVTSGLGGNYPKGLPVAEVVRFQYRPAEITQVARVAPLDDLMHLEYVLVDTDFVPEGTR